MAETYRRGKIVDYIQKLIWRKQLCVRQLEETEYSDLRQPILGQMMALDMVIHELIKEFEIQQDELK
jgi:hypothetical protein